MKELVAERVPPGDRWALINEESDIVGVKEVMENAIENLKVPFKVDVALGKSWGEAKE